MNFKHILFVVTFCFNFLVFSQTTQVEKVIADITNHSHFANGIVAVAVYDTKTGERLFSQNETLSISTASTTKLFSTAAALSILGNKTLETRFYTDGEIKDSVLTGNLWIRGGGDPALGSKYANGKTSNFLTAWVDSLRQRGIKEIKGAIIADGSEFGYKGCPDGWSWSDIGNAYGAYPSGLAIYDNVVSYRFRTGAPGVATQLISMTPEVPGLKFHNYITSANVVGDNSYIYGAPYQNDRIGIGSLQKSTTINIRGSLPNPEMQVAYEFYKKLQEQGISVTDSTITARDLLFANQLLKSRYTVFQHLFTYKGTTISDIVHWTNQHSVNMFAEQLACLLGYYKDGDGSHENGMNEMRKFWNAKIDSQGLYLMDGSGLSRSNALNVKHLCSLLNYMPKTNSFTTFYESLPVSGKSGTLSAVCRNQAAHGKIHAKSGTMRRIRSYAGYATTNSGRELTFAIVLNNYSCTNHQAKIYLERFMNALVTLP